MNGDAEDQANNEYTINVPGMYDVLRIPILTKDDKALRIQRIRRMKADTSPLPSKLKWIPTVINKIDDAEDILTVGLTLSKPLLRRLPARFVPYLGWVLLADDVLNLSTLALGVATTGPIGKRNFLDDVRRMGISREWRVKRVSKFLGKTNWFGFFLQAGQVSTTLTGYGISLGAIMGFLSDSIWGLVQAGRGAKVRLQGPPPADPYAKALRYLSQSASTPFLSTALSREDKLVMMAAESISHSLIMGQPSMGTLDTRGPLIQNYRQAVYVPYNQASLDALSEEGVSVTGDLRNVAPSTSDNLTYKQTLQVVGAQEYSYEGYQRTQLGKTDEGMIAQMMFDQAGQDAWNTTNDATDATETISRWVTILQSKMIEFGVYPPQGTPRSDFTAFGDFMESWLKSNTSRYYPIETDMRKAMLDFWGGYSTIPLAYE